MSSRCALDRDCILIMPLFWVLVVLSTETAYLLCHYFEFSLCSRQRLHTYYATSLSSRCALDRDCILIMPLFWVLVVFSTETAYLLCHYFEFSLCSRQRLHTYYATILSTRCALDRDCILIMPLFWVLVVLSTETAYLLCHYFEFSLCSRQRLHTYYATSLSSRCALDRDCILIMPLVWVLVVLSTETAYLLCH